jgi:hypothetical protein
MALWSRVTIYSNSIACYQKTKEKDIQLDVQRWRQQEMMWVIEFQVVVVTIKCRLHYLVTLLLYQIFYDLNLFIQHSEPMFWSRQ